MKDGEFIGLVSYPTWGNWGAKMGVAGVPCSARVQPPDLGGVSVRTFNGSKFARETLCLGTLSGGGCIGIATPAGQASLACIYIYDTGWNRRKLFYFVLLSWISFDGELGIVKHRMWLGIIYISSLTPVIDEVVKCWVRWNANKEYT